MTRLSSIGNGIRVLGVFVLLGGALTLLVADSAEPICDGGEAFDRTFDVSTTCGALVVNNEVVPRLGTIQVTGADSDTSCTHEECWSSSVTTISGDEIVTHAAVSGRCSKKGEKATGNDIEGITVSALADDGVTVLEYSCGNVLLDVDHTSLYRLGVPQTCSLSNASTSQYAPTCEITLTAVE